MKDQHFSVLSASSSSPYTEGRSGLGSIKIARSLSQLLILTQKLSRQSLYCHWQAMEPGATQLHSLFEQHYQSLRKAIDMIGDRIRTLGYELPDAFSKPVWGTDENDGWPLEDMIGLLIKGHQQCARESLELIGIAEMAGDDISANLAAQRHVVHEKSAWLLLALVEAKPANRSLI